jgi:hypothetical protein
MTVDAIQSELAGLSDQDRRRILGFLLSLEGDADEIRLAQSVRDAQEGRTVPADEVYQGLRKRIRLE